MYSCWYCNIILQFFLPALWQHPHTHTPTRTHTHTHTPTHTYTHTHRRTYTHSVVQYFSHQHTNPCALKCWTTFNHPTSENSSTTSGNVKDTFHVFYCSKAYIVLTTLIQFSCFAFQQAPQTFNHVDLSLLPSFINLGLARLKQLQLQGKLLYLLTIVFFLGQTFIFFLHCLTALKYLLTYH